MSEDKKPSVTPKPFVKKVPAKSAMNSIDKAADKGEEVKSNKGFKTAFKGNIDKPTAERLANRLNAIPKNQDVDLGEVVEHVVSQVEKLHAEKARRSQQNRRTISALRTTDPKDQKTCGRCGFRVSVNKMDSAKELCEVCAS